MEWTRRMVDGSWVSAGLWTGLVGITSRAFFFFSFLLSFSYFFFLYFLFLGLLISGVSPVYIQGSRSMHDAEFWVLGHGGLKGIPRAWIGVEMSRRG
ncbi:uncharacterized protein B0H64DRAFT_26819 [Chaetomium fimeti]|uniref:Transmembrane protein n=1 Tax=Chaetomium fimeti TaxID=1854472 RepID=A0AAE0LX81_9PEZI|nr:hypothetical protein B0H64DRAFT_26819 [Chaetomium fimeti]